MQFQMNENSENYTPLANTAQGLVYIDAGTGWNAYRVYIDNGTTWEQYVPYIDNGTTWVVY